MLRTWSSSHYHPITLLSSSIMIQRCSKPVQDVAPVCCIRVSPSLVRVLQALVGAALFHDKDDFIVLDIPQLCRPWNSLQLCSGCINRYAIVRRYGFSKINSRINSRINEPRPGVRQCILQVLAASTSKNFNAWHTAFQAWTFVQTCKGRVKTSCVACTMAAQTPKAAVQKHVLHLFGGIPMCVWRIWCIYDYMLYMMCMM